MLSLEQSRRIYTARAIAILCSMAAHMPVDGAAGKILALAGTTGVPFFFFLSGVLLKRGKKPQSWHFLKKVGPAWLFSGIIMWSISYLRHYTAMGLLQYVLGNGSYLYFLIVLLAIYVVLDITGCSVIPLLFAFSCFRILLSHCETLTVLNANRYLSVGYWFFWFGGGYLLSKWAGGPQKLLDKLASCRMAFLAGWGIVAVLYLQMAEINYFTWMAIPYSLLSIACLLSAGDWLPDREIFVSCGRNSLALYLWHILIAGFIAKRIPTVLVLAGPFAAMAVTEGGLLMGERLARKENGCLLIYQKLTGFHG